MSKWEEENQRKKSELEQKESLSKNEQLTNVIIDKNINYLNSNEFKSLFPFLSIYVNNNIKLIETIYESFREKYTQHKYNDDIIYFKRFTMLRDICDYTPYESYLFSSKIILLLALGILVKRDENEFAGSIKICFNSFKDRYSYRMLPDIYIIPEFNDIYFSEFENVAKQIFEAKIDVDTLNYEYVSKNYRDIFNYRCFDLSHNNKRIKYLDDKDNYNKIKEVCDWIINELEKNAYIKEHDAYDKYWEEWCSYGKNITNFYDLKCTMTTKNIKSKYGITEDGDFYILHL
jgi:hypothetical protein